MVDQDFDARLAAVVDEAGERVMAMAPELALDAVGRFRRRLLEGAEAMVRERLEAFLDESAIDRVVKRTPSELVEQALKWFEGGRPYAVLLGPPGTGKTTTACRMAMGPFLLRARRVAASHAEELVVDRGESPDFILRRLTPGPGLVVSATDLPYVVGRSLPGDPVLPPLDVRRPGVLVIDDLGTEVSAGPRFQDALFRVINARQGRATRTVITSNLDQAELQGRLDARISDRVFALGTVLRAEGQSHRGAA